MIYCILGINRIKKITKIKPLLKKTKNDRHHYKISNGFTGYNGTCIGFTGNCDGLCWPLIGCLLLVAC